MLNLSQKIEFLQSLLYKEEENYADSFKQDVIMYFDDDFSESNQSFQFLNKLSSFEEIENWLNTLTSKFVLKFDGENEDENDFIHYFIKG